ncbi:hypothetical protein HK105_203676 [Polyrhizophydium stewartii]|uniref:Biogenesis of lysosome-related organelles complex 1 subunit 7 n=1 Tax=Polyrhizophydium stewartii TaxID=2732419 RepID=A0ABR4NBJ3_9FUNG
MAAEITQALVAQLVPVLQAIDMSIIAAVRSQAELHADMERLAAELQLVSTSLEPLPETETAAVRLVAARKRIMSLQKKLRVLEDTVQRIAAHLARIVAAQGPGATGPVPPGAPPPSSSGVLGAGSALAAMIRRIGPSSSSLSQSSASARPPAS